MQEMQVQSLDQEEPLEEEMATHSRILAWKTPWTQAPGGCSPWCHNKLNTAEQLSVRTHKDAPASPASTGTVIKVMAWLPVALKVCFGCCMGDLSGKFWECQETKWETITIIHVKDVGGLRLKQCQTKRKMNLRYI